MLKGFCIVAAAAVLSGCASGGGTSKLSVSEEIYQKKLPQINEAREAGEPLLLTSLFTNKPNSAGGVNVRAWFYPLAPEDNPIKYITMEVVPYNAVGDIPASRIDGETLKTIKAVGPFFETGSDNSTPLVAENVWYNTTITCAQLNSITVEYMDGKIVEYDDDYRQIMSDEMTEFKPCGGMPRYQSPGL